MLKDQVKCVSNSYECKVLNNFLGNNLNLYNMPNCGTNGCTNRSNNCREKSFHQLPCESKKELRKTWLQKISRKHIPKELHICSDHLEPSCFIQS